MIGHTLHAASKHSQDEGEGQDVGGEEVWVHAEVGKARLASWLVSWYRKWAGAGGGVVRVLGVWLQGQGRDWDWDWD